MSTQRKKSTGNAPRTSEPGRKQAAVNLRAGSRSAGNSAASSPILRRSVLLDTSKILPKSQINNTLNVTNCDMETPADSDAGNGSPEPEISEPQKVAASKRCPCGLSSGGKAWILKCTTCNQMWHNSCVNLKGDLPKSIVNQLDHWQCPWCFTCPFEPPKKHKSRSTAKTLVNTVLSDAIVTQIENSIKSSVANSNSELLSSIRKDLDKLSKGVEEFGQSAKHHSQESIEKTEIGQQGPISSIKSDSEPPQCEAYSYKANFISDEQAADLVSFLDQEEFTVEGTRKVSSYGEKYHYKGSNNSNKPIPEELSWLTDKVKSELSLEYELNQVLVNKYESSAALPPHSDNEGSIRPDSCIFTVSLGCSGNIEFTHINSGSKQELSVEANSIYSMSRQSQNFYKHHVLQNNSDQVRYSITFRCVHWTFYNSTYAVGDSNFGRIEFGSGRGKVGTATPGIRDWAACVKDIVPTKCASYRNIVVMCGTNDLKDGQCDVQKTYQTFKGKIEEIRELNQNGNIFVCPILPTRDQVINQKVNAFNRYLFNDLQQANLKVIIVQGFKEFADYRGFLNTILHDKRTPNDVLHINNKGYCILVKLIKQAIFSVKNKANKNVTGRLFSDVIISR